MQPLSIGNLARATGLTVRALRHYQELGLLVPAGVDPATGYRAYGPEQLERAQEIARLRRLGLGFDDAGPDGILPASWDGGGERYDPGLGHLGHPLAGRQRADRVPWRRAGRGRLGDLRAARDSGPVPRRPGALPGLAADPRRRQRLGRALATGRRGPTAGCSSSTTSARSRPTGH
jgi:MerR HTH family regulatory protein